MAGRAFIKYVIPARENESCWRRTTESNHATFRTVPLTKLAYHRVVLLGLGHTWQLNREKEWQDSPTS